MLDHDVMDSGLERADCCNVLWYDISWRATVTLVGYLSESLPTLPDTDTCPESDRIKIQVHAFLSQESFLATARGFVVERCDGSSFTYSLLLLWKRRLASL